MRKKPLGHAGSVRSTSCRRRLIAFNYQTSAARTYSSSPPLPSSFRETFVWTMSRDITFALYHSWYSTDARLAYSRIRILSSCTFVRRNFLGRMRVFVATADR